MTSSANDEWNHFELMRGISALQRDMRKNIALGVDKSAVAENNKCLQHTIDFIEYNMHEMEITRGNGD